jgi:hypothetical protein
MLAEGADLDDGSWITAACRPILTHHLEEALPGEVRAGICVPLEAATLRWIDWIGYIGVPTDPRDPSQDADSVHPPHRHPMSLADLRNEFRRDAQRLLLHRRIAPRVAHQLHVHRCLIHCEVARSPSSIALRHQLRNAHCFSGSISPHHVVR